MGGPSILSNFRKSRHSIQFQRSEWRMLLQPVIVAVSEEGLVTVVGDVEIEAAEEDVVEEERKRRTGFQSPSLAVWLRMERSKVWRRSISSHFQLKSMRSSTCSSDPL